jgi:hypothetical protein
LYGFVELLKSKLHKEKNQVKSMCRTGQVTEPLKLE